MDTIAVVRLALNVISERLLTIMALAMVFGLACYTMSNPDPLRLGTMAFFAMFSYLLLKNREKKNEKSERLAE